MVSRSLSSAGPDVSAFRLAMEMTVSGSLASFVSADSAVEIQSTPQSKDCRTLALSARGFKVQRSTANFPPNGARADSSGATHE